MFIFYPNFTIIVVQNNAMLQKFNPQNKNLQIWVGDRLYPREEAKVSVFDSTVQGGDAVWEGIRVYDGKIFCLDKHLQRLQESAKALAFEHIPSNDSIKEAIFKTLEANAMRDGVHIRLTLSRGIKYTSGMDPRLNDQGPLLIVLAEWKPPVYDKKIKLGSCHIRRNNPQFLDSKIHHNNLLNNILAKIQANLMGVDEAIMLDERGFASESNATNIFMSKAGTLYTPFACNCLPGITRATVLDIAKSIDIPAFEKDISTVELYNADEVFVTGTMGELTTVVDIDGRIITNDSGIAIKPKIEEVFRKKVKNEGEALPF